MEQPEDLGRFFSGIGVAVSHPQIESLRAYEGLLRTRGVALGMIAEGDSSRIWERHVLDCARVMPWLPERGTCLDVGSGGGLPGVVVAILRPELSVELVERRERKAGFLELVIRELGLGNAHVEARAIESLRGIGAEAATARALASPQESWKLARPSLGEGGRLVYFAGQGTEVPPRFADSSALELVEPPPSLPAAGPLVIITR